MWNNSINKNGHVCNTCKLVDCNMLQWTSNGCTNKSLKTSNSFQGCSFFWKLTEKDHQHNVKQSALDVEWLVHAA